MATVGNLPFGLSTVLLRQPHATIPSNPLLAEPLYLAGFIERLGTGIPDMIDLCRMAGLKEPEFSQEDTFKTILWRMDSSDGDATRQATRQATGQATGQADEETTRQATHQATRQATRQADEEVAETIRRVVLVLNGEMKRVEIQEKLGLKDRENFVLNYLTPALNSVYIEMTIPDVPTHQEQRYRLAIKGIGLKKKLRKSKKK